MADTTTSFVSSLKRAAKTSTIGTYTRKLRQSVLRGREKISVYNESTMNQALETVPDGFEEAVKSLNWFLATDRISRFQRGFHILETYANIK